MSSTKRNARGQAGEVVSVKDIWPEENTPARTRERRYRVIATKANGRRAILCTGLSRDEAEHWVDMHRPFARAAGGDVGSERE